MDIQGKKIKFSEFGRYYKLTRERHIISKSFISTRSGISIEEIELIESGRLQTPLLDHIVRLNSALDIAIKSGGNV